MKERLLIINKEQFGSLTDSYKWCQYLRDDYDITFICFDSGRDKLSQEGVIVKYVSPGGPKVLRAIRFLLYCCLEIIKLNSKVIVVYFENCHILKILFPKIPMQMDIRTLAVSGNQKFRSRYDSGISKSAKYFDTVSVISEPIRDLLGLKGGKIHILPLGADVISDVPKNFDTLKLLYVGTLNGRNISQTLIGLQDFIMKNNNVAVTYDIVGDGHEYEILRNLIMALDLSKIVTLHGRISYDKLKPFFDSCNVGISFIPIVDYYNNQPPTKIYEYALSGLYQIATATNANRRLINDFNGILVGDSSEDFSAALSAVYNKRTMLDEDAIRNSLGHSTWDKIVGKELKAILYKLN